MRPSWPVCAVAACLLGALPNVARAESGDELFQRGKALLEKGLLTEACTTLAKAEAVSPSVGSIGLLAACHEKQGRTATASREYREAAKRAAAAHDSRERYAQERVTQLEPAVPRLVLRLPPGENLAITLGAAALEPSTLAAAVRVDPGPIEVTATSLDGKRWSTRLVIERGEERVIEIPSLAAPKPAPKPPHNGPFWPAYLAGGIGVAGLGVMTGFGISAVVQNSDSRKLESECSMLGTGCEEGAAERGRAQTFGNIATAGFAVGVAGLGAAALLWAFDVGSGAGEEAQSGAAPKSVSIRLSPVFTSGGALVGVRGAF